MKSHFRTVVGEAKMRQAEPPALGILETPSSSGRRGRLQTRPARPPSVSEGVSTSQGMSELFPPEEEQRQCR